MKKDKKLICGLCEKEFKQDKKNTKFCPDCRRCYKADLLQRHTLYRQRNRRLRKEFYDSLKLKKLQILHSGAYGMGFAIKEVYRLNFHGINPPTEKMTKLITQLEKLREDLLQDINRLKLYYEK
ncbi:MAG: hypothetical protein ACOC1P_00335 [Minisyncoccales bacterium]